MSPQRRAAAEAAAGLRGLRVEYFCFFLSARARAHRPRCPSRPGAGRRGGRGSAAARRPPSAATRSGPVRAARRRRRAARAGAGRPCRTARRPPDRRPAWTSARVARRSVRPAATSAAAPGTVCRKTSRAEPAGPWREERGEPAPQLVEVVHARRIDGDLPVVGRDQQQRARDGPQAALERVERGDGGGVELARCGPVVVARSRRSGPSTGTRSRVAAARRPTRRRPPRSSRTAAAARPGRHAVVRRGRERRTAAAPSTARPRPPGADTACRRRAARPGRALPRSVSPSSSPAYENSSGVTIASSAGSYTFHSYSPCAPTGRPVCIVVMCAVVVERELARQRRHGEPAQERVAGVPLEEPAAERVEQDDRHPVALTARQQPLDRGGDVDERAHRGRTLLADRPVESDTVRVWTSTTRPSWPSTARGSALAHRARGGGAGARRGRARGRRRPPRMAAQARRGRAGRGHLARGVRGQGLGPLHQVVVNQEIGRAGVAGSST